MATQSKAEKAHDKSRKKAEKRVAAQDNSKMWAVMSLISGLIAAQIARRALNTGWKAATGKEPPANPADPDVAMREAVLWAAVSGTTIALSRMAIGRRAANYYARSTGHLPPELEADDVREQRKTAALAEVEAEETARKVDKLGRGKMK